MFARIKSWLTRHRGVLLVALAAFAVRLVWNLWVHPPLDFAYSDMGGYIDRANQMLKLPWKPRPYFSLFPYGTHALLFVVKGLFGRDNGAAIGTVFALLGAIAVAATYATAKRLTKTPAVPRIVAALLIVYYPWISLGGYALSEIPFAACLSVATFLTLRLADEGRPRDAWLLGLVLGLGAIVRSQMTVSVAFIALHWLFRRRAWKNFQRSLWLRAAIPLVVILGISSARVYWHTGLVGLVSTNGPLNYAFGRCHCTSLEAQAKDGKGFFGPPPFGALLNYGKDHPNALFTLDPAMGTSVKFKGHMWDPPPIYEVARQCVQKTGYWRQAKYAVTHAVLLWGYNIPWPDQGQKPVWRKPMAIWSGFHLGALLPPAALAMALAFRRRRARTLLLSLHVVAAVLVAMVYFGDSRLRVPYDGLIALLAVDMYVTGARWLLRRMSALRTGPKVVVKP